MEPSFRSSLVKATTHSKTLIPARINVVTTQWKTIIVVFTTLFTPVCQLLHSVQLLKINKFASDVSQYLITFSDTTRYSNE